VPVIKMLSGLPGSGKSTEAKRQIDENNNLGRVNRDDLRAMIFNSKWSPFREQIIIQIEKAIVAVLVKNQMGVIVDDTNISSKHESLWRDFAEDQGNCRFEVQKMDTSIDTCVVRDKARHDRVGKADHPSHGPHIRTDPVG
jgi:tRNA uridine 5-carbamoylmethylation protein Kti12